MKNSRKSDPYAGIQAAGLNLSVCEHFRGLSAQELDNVFAGICCRTGRIEAGKLAYLRGQPWPDLVYILEGRLQAHIGDEEGHTVLIETLGRGQAVASGILFCENSTLPVNLTAETDTELLFIPGTEVLELMSRSKVFLYNYLTDMSGKIIFLAEKIRLLRFNSLRQKIAGYVLGLPEQPDGSLAAGYGRETLAELMGVTRPALSREISSMAREGFFRVEGRKLLDVKRQALSDLLE